MASIGLPANRSLAGEYSQTLSAQLGILPNMLSGQAEWQPVQTANQLSNINQLLLGTPDLNYQTQVYSPAVYRQGGTYSYGKLPPFVQGQIQYPHVPDNTSTGSSGGGGGFGGFFGAGLPGMGGFPGIPSPGDLGIGWGGGGGYPTPPGVPQMGNVRGYPTPPGFNSYGGYPLPPGTPSPGQPPPGVPSVGGPKSRITSTGSTGGEKSRITSNSYPGSIGSYNGMPLPPTPLGPLDPFSSLFGGGSGKPPRQLVSPSGYQTVNHSLAPQQGLLTLYRDYLAPTMEQTQEAQQSSQRTADVADVSRLGPAALAAFKQSDPATANLIDTLTQHAQDQLNAGSKLDPELQRAMEQNIRSSQASRGMGYGPSDVFNESMGLTQFGEQLRQQRQAFAGQAAGLRNSIYGDPFQRILNRQGAGLGGASNALQQAIGLGGASGPLGLLNPESQYAQDLHNTNFNALVNAAIGNANNQNAIIGAGISAVGSMAGSAMKFGM